MEFTVTAKLTVAIIRFSIHCSKGCTGQRGNVQGEQLCLKSSHIENVLFKYSALAVNGVYIEQINTKSQEPRNSAGWIAHPRKTVRLERSQPILEHS
jgi:hypothetical protein